MTARELAPRGSSALRDAIWFWESRRPFYNIVLTVVALGWFAATWPHFRHAATLNSMAALLVLALLANACYCVAYLPELAARRSPPFLRHRWRSGAWIVGTLLAVVVENYWIADEIYRSVH